jgi:hypothetical protein
MSWLSPVAPGRRAANWNVAERLAQGGAHIDDGHTRKDVGAWPGDPSRTIGAPHVAEAIAYRRFDRL